MVVSAWRQHDGFWFQRNVLEEAAEEYRIPGRGWGLPVTLYFKSVIFYNELVLLLLSGGKY